ncbi:MAG: condensation domain-containing protein, partial [Rhodothermia bacterium]
MTDDPHKNALDALLADAESRLTEASATPIAGSSAEGMLSVAQEYLWSYHRLDPGNPSHNRSTAFRILGRLDLELLSQSLDALLDRHPELRASFPAHEGQPHRTDSGLSRLEFDVVDLSDPRHPSNPGASMLDFVRPPFDLESGPLIRARLLHVADKEFILHLVIHHIVIDAWSAGILISDLRDIYHSLSAGRVRNHGSQPASASYSDFVALQLQALQDGSIDAMVQRTLKRLEGAPTVLQLPTDRKRPHRRTGMGVSESFVLDRETLDRAENFARQEGATLNMLLSAVFALLLHRYTRLDDILIGIPYAGRDERRFDRTVGLFMNFLVLRADLQGNPSFRELLSRIRTDSIEMLATSDAPFELVARHLHTERDAGHTSLVQVLFNMETDEDGGGKPGSSPAFESFVHNPGLSTHDLSVEALRSGNHLTFEWTGNADIFDVTTIRRMAGHYGNLLDGVLASPETRLDALPLISPNERSQMLAMSRAPDKPYPKDKPLHVLFEEWVEKAPDKTAIFDDDTTVTYRELNERANQLAHILIEQGVEPGDIIPVFLERSIELVTAWIAVSKAGAAFIGLDPLDPVERILWIAGDISAPVIVASNTQASQLRERKTAQTIIDPANRDWVQSNRSNPGVTVRADDAAILLYTSGSTGTPKGVLSSHRSLTSLVFRLVHVDNGPHTVSLMMSSPSFDAVLSEIWTPLIHGGSTVVYRARLPSARAIEEAITRFGINDIW